jgi:alkaline phosphatase
MKKWCTLIICLTIAGVLAVGSGAAEANKKRMAKNIILMVPDGMGLSDVTATRIFKNGLDGDGLSFEKLKQIGYQRTYSANSVVTDSAAAAGAWATGEKYVNGEISCHTDASGSGCESSPTTILEIAQKRGKATGLIATSDITHATPAVFAAHVHSRKCGADIGRQMVESGVDILLGAGIAEDGDNCPQEITAAEVIATAPDYGYKVVETRSELNSALGKRKTGKILGLFNANGGKSPENFWIDESFTYPENEPTLQEMTVAALDFLQKDQQGFFLMVEGSQIDWANHGHRFGLEDIESDPNDPYAAPNTQLGEMLAFDAAVESVLEWVNAKKSRKNSTLIIVVADHETGGFHVNGPYGSLLEAGETVDGGWTTGGHTGQDTLIWSQGPGSHLLGRALENTDIFTVMKHYMK